MTIYETENQEIIDLYNLYIEVKTFILKFENLKLLFKEHHNLKQTKSYIVFEGSTWTSEGMSHNGPSTILSIPWRQT